MERIEIKHFDDLHIVFEFSELFQQLMYFYKYQGYRDIALYFAEALRKNIAPDYDLVTFVPLHSVKQRERGFNQSAFIAENFCKLTGLTFSTDVLMRERYTKSQTKFNRKKRQDNVKDAFSVKTNVTGKRILLIDDVITTGATLNECSKVLKEAKSKKVDIAAIATPVNILQNRLEAEENNNLIFT